MARKPKQPKQITALTHGEASRKNIPTAEHQAVLGDGERKAVPVSYERRDRDLDPQLMWQGKDEQDWQDLVVPAPPLFIQEKVKPKALIDDLLRHSKEDQTAAEPQVDLFADFNGLPDDNARTEFYEHDANWTNRRSPDSRFRPPRLRLRARAAHHAHGHRQQRRVDVIYDEYETKLEPLREALNQALGKQYEEWQIPREANDERPSEAEQLHAEWWQHRIARQQAIDASIAAKADYETLYDKPFEDSKRVRVAGPFTVESLSPHRALTVDEGADAPAEEVRDERARYQTGDGNPDFAGIILENLQTAGVQQVHKDDRITFASLEPWPGTMVCAEGRYAESGNGKETRAAIFVGPEFGTVSRTDLVEAAHEAAEARFDVLIACAFNYDAAASEFAKLGRVPILKARMNEDLHMAKDFKKTSSANLFVVFGEPDIDILPTNGGADDDQLQVKINGVDVYHPASGEIRSDETSGIACWFVDTDYDHESFFVRQAYFLGAGDPYKSLRTTLKAEINGEAWATLNSDTSRPFPKPTSGRIAVKVINHLGDEVMKVFQV